MFMHNFCSCYINFKVRIFLYVLVHRNILMYDILACHICVDILAVKVLMKSLFLPAKQLHSN